MLQGKRAKLSDGEVQAIRLSYYKDFDSLDHLSKKYGLSVPMIYKVVKYQSYKNVKDHPDITEDMVKLRVPFRTAQKSSYQRKVLNYYARKNQ